MCFSKKRNFKRKSKEVVKPEGINLLENLNVIHMDKWNKDNYDYHHRYATVIQPNKQLRLHAGHCNTISVPDKISPVWKDFGKNWAVSQTKPQNHILNDKNYDWKYYKYVSGKVIGQGIDLTRPGRIVSKWHIGEFAGAVPSMLMEGMTKDTYFEIDIFEVFREGFLFSDHMGTGHPNLTSHREVLKIHDGGCCYPELVWDGTGVYIWKLNGVTMKSRILDVPKFKPEVRFTLGCHEPCIDEQALVEWAVLEQK